MAENLTRFKFTIILLQTPKKFSCERLLNWSGARLR